MQSFIGWIGGKRALRKDILAMFPQNHSRYIEVFGGAGWVLFGKTYSAGQLEVFNDADGSLINIYRCIKYHPDALAAELSGLPQSREIFFDWQNQICQRGYTDIQRAARSLYLVKESFGSDRRTFATAPRISENISASFSEVQKRLRKVIIENLDFERLIRIYDRQDALFYCSIVIRRILEQRNTTKKPSRHRTMKDWLKCYMGSRENSFYRTTIVPSPENCTRIVRFNR